MTIIEPVRLALVAASAFVVSIGGTALLIRYLVRRQVLDQPNERSSHSVPTPRGGGIAVLSAILAGWLIDGLMSGTAGLADLVIPAAAVGLSLICFFDDLRGLPALPRLLAQVAAVAPGLWLLADRGGLFAAVLPPVVDLALTGFLWLWFINLFNFMDGIDGITGVEMAALGIGLAGLSVTGQISLALLGPALAVTAAALGFLVWNWQPARIFMGDVGSVPAGYLIGWLLLSAVHGDGAMGNGWVFVLILPAYYLADSSITLARRLLKGENVLRAHRQHFYQRAVIRGHGHGRVCGSVILANAVLIIIAWSLAAIYPSAAFGSAASVVGLLLLWMQGAPTAMFGDPAAN
jgi:UDP-N-acetylmuramyl pentapeptide phosphotransferase/UDP-N-acetylglucosamine-1-phosphate transferase